MFRINNWLHIRISKTPKSLEVSSWRSQHQHFSPRYLESKLSSNYMEILKANFPPPAVQHPPPFPTWVLTPVWGGCSPSHTPPKLGSIPVNFYFLKSVSTCTLKIGINLYLYINHNIFTSEGGGQAHQCPCPFGEKPGTFYGINGHDHAHFADFRVKSEKY